MRPVVADARRAAAAADDPADLPERTGEDDIGRAFLAVIEAGAVTARVTPRRPGACSGRSDTTRARSRCCLWCPVSVGAAALRVRRPAARFQQIGAPLCGMFPFILMFLVTSITMLRERTTGTLERLMTLPLAKLDLLPATRSRSACSRVAAAMVCVVGFGSSALTPPHGAAGRAARGRQRVAGDGARAAPQRVRADRVPGRAVHAGADFPQLLLCGLFVARDVMAPLLEAVSWALPLTYAYDALARATTAAPLGSALLLDVLAVAAAPASEPWHSER